METIYDAYLTITDIRLERWRCNRSGYIVLSILAGFFIGLGFFVAERVADMLQTSSMRDLISALAFTIGLLLVIYAGSELFTGTLLSFGLSGLARRASWRTMGVILVCIWFGNAIGATLVSLMARLAHVSTIVMDKAIVTLIAEKTTMAPFELVVRAILCNVFICFAIWASLGLRSESARVLVSVPIIAAFICLKLEHCIANVAIFAYAYTLPHALFQAMGVARSAAAMAQNLLLSTLGNAIGAVCFVALPYHLVLKRRT